jgi:hypothetical protein
MRLPGFTAEAALYVSHEPYRASTTDVSTSQRVLAQQDDDPWRRVCRWVCDPLGWCEYHCHTLIA